MRAPKISIQIGADTGRLRKDMAKADGIVSKFSRGASMAFNGLAAAAAGAAFKIGVDGVKSAIEDEKSQANLAQALRNTTKATDDQIAATEEYITKTQLRYGKSDVALRASLAKLAAVSKSTTKAQQLQAIALDVSAGANISLEAATTLVAKAQSGSFTGFTRLGIKLDENILKTKNADAATAVLASTYSGAAATAADTMSGKMDRLNEKWGEAQEQIGTVLLEGLEPLMDWFQTPEAEAIITDFVDVFGDGVKVIAEKLPVIVDNMKDLGGNIGDLGLDKLFGDPKLLAAALAFAKTPGPFQIKLLAAVAAYAGIGIITEDPAARKKEMADFQGMLGRTTGLGGGAAPPLNYGSYFQGTWSGAQSAAQMAWQQTGQTAAGTTVINVNGIIDGKSAALAVQTALKQANANGVSTTGRTGGR